MNCPWCIKPILAIVTKDVATVEPIPVEPDPIVEPVTQTGKTGIYFPPRSDGAAKFFTVLNEIDGGVGTRADPLRWRAGSFGALRFKMDYAQIPADVRKYTFTIRGHLQLTHPCTKIDPYQNTKFAFDQFSGIFEFPLDVILEKAGDDYLDETRSNRTIYLNVSDNSQEDDTCYFTSGKLFLREVD